MTDETRQAVQDERERILKGLIKASFPSGMSGIRLVLLIEAEHIIGEGNDGDNGAAAAGAQVDQP